MTKLIKVSINGQDMGTYTEDAYAELRLQMSTGDFHVHKIKKIKVKEVDWDNVIDLDLLIDQVNGLENL